MQEYEFLHEHEGEQTYEYGQEFAHEEMQSEAERIATLAEIDEVQTRHVALWKSRLLVLAFYTSFLACLAVLWFSGILLSAPDGLLSPVFIQFMADYRLLVLSVPVAFLVACYLCLRRLTGEIMAVPESYLDERQKMLRDQAHRSAFKLVKLACLLIPCSFLLPHLPWFNHLTSGIAQNTISSNLPQIYMVVPDAPYITTLRHIHYYTASGVQVGETSALHMSAVSWRILRIEAVTRAIRSGIPPASTTEIVVAGGLLLLCLLLMASALPMTTLAWKGKL